MAPRRCSDRTHRMLTSINALSYPRSSYLSDEHCNFVNAIKLVFDSITKKNEKDFKRDSRLLCIVKL